MTYSSRTFLISCGLGSLSRARSARSSSSSRMMSLQSSTHSSQTNTDGPAISLRTSCWLLPQKEQYSSLPSSCLPRESSDMDRPQQVSASQSLAVLAKRTAQAIGSVAGYIACVAIRLQRRSAPLVMQPDSYGNTRCAELLSRMWARPRRASPARDRSGRSDGRFAAHEVVAVGVRA